MSIPPGCSSRPPERRPTTPLKQYRVRAETLEYDEAARTAIYKGPRVVDDHTTDSDVEAGSADVPARGRVAGAGVHARRRAPCGRQLSGGYEAIGDVLVYRADTDLYTLEGKAGQETAQVKSPRADSPVIDERPCAT